MGMKTAAAAVVAGAGTFVALGMLEKTDSDTIRAMGEKVSSAVKGAGSKLMDSEIGQEIRAKIEGSEYGPQAMEFLGRAGEMASSGFDRMVGALADCKDASEANGTSFTAEAFGALSDAVATGTDYIAEKTGIRIPMPSDPSPESEPDAPAPQAEDDGYGMEM